jgi:lipopolysaccharide kinase (Kdo/WaaP) family protein
MSAVWHQRYDADWPALAPRDPELIMSAALTDRFHAKQGRSIVRWTLGEGRLVVYLKRHFRDSRWLGLLARITGRPDWSAAWTEFENLRWAASAGLPVPRAVAVGTCVGPKTRLRSYLAIEELAASQALHELIPRASQVMSATDFHIWKCGLVYELARLVGILHGRRRFHRDLYLCHFFAPERSIYARPANWRNQVALIDLHRLAHRRLFWRWWQLKDLAQLLYSSDILGINARDRLRFWRLYAGPGRRRWIGPWLRRLILLRWKNYRDHNAARRVAA